MNKFITLKTIIIIHKLILLEQKEKHVSKN